MRDLLNTVALITGGSSGMGLGTAVQLKKLGAKVIIAARREVELLEAQRISGADDVLVLDVTNPRDWEKAQAFVAEKYGKIDFLINGAGGGVAIVPFLEQTQEQIDQSIQLNLYGAMNGCKAFAPMMVEAKSGLIINVLSVCATHAWPAFSVYSAAKAGLRMFTKCLFLELQPHNVRVTNFIPAAAKTNFAAAAGRPEGNNLLTGGDVGEAIAQLCQMNEHMVPEEITVWGIDQEVCPL